MGDLGEVQRFERVAGGDHSIYHALCQSRIDFAHRHVDGIRAKMPQNAEQFGGRTDSQAAEVCERAYWPVPRQHAGQFLSAFARLQQELAR